MFVGMKLISGHTCPPNSPSLQAEIDDIKARLAAHRERKQRNPDE
ncbi:MAG: hypothetical protein QOJ29_708 [Thermoleophilaceae bacterium]|jgi:hypothetical protein|nr:hypothetical protein [Thermoleophilaceae bacterium]